MEKKESIIQISADLIHKYGYNNIGIKSILDEAKIPKGSFYHYFSSKEDLVLNVIEYHIQNTKFLFNQFDKNIDGLKKFFNTYFTLFEQMQYTRGCPIGNLILELSDLKESFRLKLLEWAEFLEKEIYEILENSNLDQNIDKKSLASFIISNFEGVILKTKLEKNKKPIEEFNYYVFKILLNEGGKTNE